MCDVAEREMNAIKAVAKGVASRHVEVNRGRGEFA